MAIRTYGTDNIKSDFVGEASIIIEGSGRVATIPYALKELLLKKGWTNSRIFWVYDDKEDRLILVNRGRVMDKIKAKDEAIKKEIKNAAGLIWQYKGTEIKENCS